MGLNYSAAGNSGALTQCICHQRDRDKSHVGTHSLGYMKTGKVIPGYQQVAPALYRKKNVPRELPSHFAKDLPRERDKA